MKRRRVRTWRWSRAEAVRSTWRRAGGGKPAAHRRPSLVMEPRGVRPVVNRRRLLLEARQLTLQVAHEQVGQVVGEAAPDDDPEGGEILPVLREAVRGHLPATLAHGVRDVEDGEVVHLVS